ncbi:unnamed protein product, partial [Owenia fusiformis]
GERICKDNFYGGQCDVFCKPEETFGCDDKTGNKMCHINYYGDNCAVFCIQGDGYYCDTQTGRKICRWGFYGIECDVFCEEGSTFVCDQQTGARICFPDYYGQECSTHCSPINSTDISFTCNPRTGGKICEPGFDGPNCTIVLSSSSPTLPSVPPSASQSIISTTSTSKVSTNSPTSYTSLKTTSRWKPRSSMISQLVTLPPDVSSAEPSVAVVTVPDMTSPPLQTSTVYSKPPEWATGTIILEGRASKKQVDKVKYTIMRVISDELSSDDTSEVYVGILPIETGVMNSGTFSKTSVYATLATYTKVSYYVKLNGEYLAAAHIEEILSDMPRERLKEFPLPVFRIGTKTMKTGKNKPQSSNHLAAIVGILVGCMALLVCVIVIVAVILKKRRHNKEPPIDYDMQQFPNPMYDAINIKDHGTGTTVKHGQSNCSSLYAVVRPKPPEADVVDTPAPDYDYDEVENIPIFYAKYSGDMKLGSVRSVYDA